MEIIESTLLNSKQVEDIFLSTVSYMEEGALDDRSWR